MEPTTSRRGLAIRMLSDYAPTGPRAGDIVYVDMGYYPEGFDPRTDPDRIDIIDEEGIAGTLYAGSGDRWEFANDESSPLDLGPLPALPPLPEELLGILDRIVFQAARGFAVGLVEATGGDE